MPKICQVASSLRVRCFAVSFVCRTKCSSSGLLMVAAALMTGSPPERLGLYQHLEDAFRLDELSGTMSQRAFQEVRTLSK